MICRNCETIKVQTVYGVEQVVELCTFHAATDDLLAACKAALPAILWGATHQPGNASQWREVETVLSAAIAKAKKGTL